MKKLTRLLALLLTAVMAMSALCVSSSAASGYTKLENMSYTYTEHASTVSQFVSGNGTEYKSFAIVLDPWNEDYVTVKLDKKYSFVSGVLVAGKFTGRGNYPINMYIYGDEKLLLKSAGMGNGGKDVKFNLDVRGVKELKVQAVYNTEGSCRYSYLAECKFQKNSLKLSDEEIKLDVKGSHTLKFTYKDASDKNITTGKIKYASENSKIAKVSSKGKIVGVSAGVTNVSVTTPDGLVEKCKVIVLPKKVTGVKLVSVTSDSVTIEWDKVDGAESYEVGIIDPDLDEYEKQTNVKKTKATIKNLESNTEYTVMVRARIKDGSKYYKGSFSDGLKTKTAK